MCALVCLGVPWCVCVRVCALMCLDVPWLLCCRRNGEKVIRDGRKRQEDPDGYWQLLVSQLFGGDHSTRQVCPFICICICICMSVSMSMSMSLSLSMSSERTCCRQDLTMTGLIRPKEARKTAATAA